MISVIIPIKEHSERVPNKNFRDFNGKPLFRWLIDRLINDVPEINQVIINTDSQTLFDTINSYGNSKLSANMRREDLRGDSVDVNLIIKSELDNLKNDMILQTHVTNPLLKGSTISSAVKALEVALKDGYDSLMSVTPYKKRFYFDGKPVNHNPNELIKTQDLTPVVEENSNIYLFTKETFNKFGRRVGGNPYLFEMGFLESMDIDYMDDFILTEAIAKLNLVK